MSTQKRFFIPVLVLVLGAGFFSGYYFLQERVGAPGSLTSSDSSTPIRRALATIPTYSIDTSCNPGSNHTYDVGPGKTYSTISAVPLDSLQAGDTVRVFWQSQPYKELLFLTASGTAANPITLCGVPGPSGQLPVLDGNGATTSSQFAVASASYLQGLGVIDLTIGSHDPGGYYNGNPRNWEIRNFEIQGAYPGNPYTDNTGKATTYSGGAACIHLQRADNINFRNLNIHDCGNGFFVNSPNGVFTHNILLEGSYLHNNGVVGSDQQHAAYSEASGMTYQYNHFGPNKDGSSGSNLKDRSAGTVIRYNWIEGGGHLIDLVDTENAAPAMLSEPNYNDAYVYGNILVNPPTSHASATMIHFGGDSGVFSNYRKNLHFFNNTVATYGDQSQRWRGILFSFDSGDGSQVIYADNNIIYAVSATPGKTATELDLANSKAVLRLGKNWISPGWVAGNGYPTFTGTVTGTENVVSPAGNNPGFANLTYANLDPRPGAGATTLGLGSTVDTNRANYPVQYQYLVPQSAEVRSLASDLGAYQYSTLPVSTPVPTPNPTPTPMPTPVAATPTTTTPQAGKAVVVVTPAGVSASPTPTPTVVPTATTGATKVVVPTAFHTTASASPTPTPKPGTVGPSPSPALQILSAAIVDIRSTAATVTVTTNRDDTVMNLSYGIAAANELHVGPTNRGANQSVILTNLATTTTYHLVISLQVADGTTVTSDDLLFTTLDPLPTGVTRPASPQIRSVYVRKSKVDPGEVGNVFGRHLTLTIFGKVAGATASGSVVATLHSTPLKAEGTIQSDGTWSVSFDTTGLESGQHVVQVVTKDSKGVLSLPVTAYSFAYNSSNLLYARQVIEENIKTYYRLLILLLGVALAFTAYWGGMRWRQSLDSR